MFQRSEFKMEEAGGAGAAGGGAAGTGATAAGAGAAGAGAGAGTGTPAAFDWTPHVADEAVRGWVAAKGFKDPGALAQSALNQEKLLGVPAESIVKLPKDDNADAWNAVYDRLGRPKDPKEYGLPLPEGDKGEFAAEAAKWFHEAGLNGKQGRTVAEKWNAHVAAAQKQQSEATKARDAEQVTKLKADWGPQFEPNMALVDKAAQAFGISTEHVQALKAAMGPGAAAKFLHAIGSKLGVEGDFVSGGARGGSGNFSTPEAAQAQIAALREDKGFVQRFAAGDSEARAEMKRLHRLAYPGDTVL